MSKMVIALGGNALGSSPEEQIKLVQQTASSLVDLIAKGHQVVISHGNGPQVGLINLAMNYAAEHDQAPVFPFPECGAMSQGYIGYHLQQSLQNELRRKKITKPVVTLITQVEVDPKDPAFSDPTKPIGSFYNKTEAEKITKEKGYVFVEDAGRGYRRVVASPLPKEIVELKSINNLIATDTVVIASGGGGVPVVKEQGSYTGVPAVIDKDKSSALLACELAADQLVILTAVDFVYVNYGKENQVALRETTSAELQQYMSEKQFSKGSMLPKIEACLSFIKKNPTGTALITSLAHLDEALAGKIGTSIKK